MSEILLHEEFIVSEAAGYPDPHRCLPNTEASARRFAEEHRRLPEFPAIILKRWVSVWEKVE